MININAKVGVKNTYEFTLKKQDGSENTYVSHNMVLDNYFTYLLTNNAAPSFSVIRLGQGTGAVSASQTALGSLRASYTATATDDATGKPAVRVLQYTIPEGTLTGNISEIGLTNNASGSTVFTRALVQDAEGNPIVIEKGALDILTIMVTVYYEFTYDVDEDFFIVIDEVYMSGVLMTGGSNSILTNTASYFTSVIGPGISNRTNASRLRQTYTDSSIVVDVPNKTIRANGAVITAANGNGSMATPEWAARGIGTLAWMIDVEKSGLFTPYQYNNLSLGVGDGVETAFDIPLVFFRAEDVQVTIDGVLQDPETYVVEPQSLRRSLRAAPSAQADCCTFINYPSVISCLFSSGTCYDSLGGSESAVVREARYDFIEPITVTHMFGKNDPYPSGTNAARPNPNNINLYSSDNGTDWTLVFNRTASIGTQNFLVMPLSDPVTARYFRLTYIVNSQNSAWALCYDPILAFGRDVKSITFNTPPVSGAVLVAKVLSRVPIKNSNFQLGSSVQMRFERG
jgi:hypothetical protein